MDLTGKVAVITGGGSGIGRATAQRLASEGAAIVIADLDSATGHEAVGLIERAGGRAVFAKVNVTDAEQAARMLDTAISRFGRLDILHNNAGTGMSLRVSLKPVWTPGAGCWISTFRRSSSDAIWRRL